MSESLKIVAFLGSVRQGRMCERVAKFVRKCLEDRGHTVTVIDPLELGLGQVIQPMHFYRNPAEIPAILPQLNEQLKEADAFIAIAGEYNSQISPALCSVMDHFPPVSYAFRPSAIVTYSMGNYGGIRAAMLLRQFLSELTTVHMPNMLVISKVHESLNDAGECAGEDATSRLPKAADSMINQLEWYARALKKEREVGLPKQ
ncbi:uncharacterized protein LOC129585162 [Paramacrobiotus metropolitanus]|uniref:uncharacterized protein LOC129585162 n=1 Tax=Paramacrobiotus metropolitanus TaxID=2943436 RepID=UPI002445CB01|nr:uncharacterized protein LOC129585162 [Paramacrobiotus metropolitanus]